MKKVLKKFAAAGLAAVALAATVGPAGQATAAPGFPQVPALNFPAMPGPVGSSNPFAALAQCSPTVVVAVPGGGNTVLGIPPTLPHGFLVGGVTKQLAAHGFAHRTVSYDAQPFFNQSYDASAAGGYAKALAVVAGTAAQCPDSRIALVGFSEGADIASRVARDIGVGRGPIAPERLASAALIANPNYGPASAHKAGTSPGGEGLLGAMDTYGEAAERVLDICNADDFVCNSRATSPGVRALAQGARGASVFTGLGTLDPMLLVGELPQVLIGWQRHMATYRWSADPVPAAVGHILANG